MIVWWRGGGVEVGEKCGRDCNRAHKILLLSTSGQSWSQGSLQQKLILEHSGEKCPQKHYDVVPWNTHGRQNREGCECRPAAFSAQWTSAPAPALPAETQSPQSPVSDPTESSSRVFTWASLRDLRLYRAP